MVRRVNQSVLYALFCLTLLSLQSCATLKRALSKDDTPYMTAAQIDSLSSHNGRIEEVFYDCSSFPGPHQRRMLVYLPEGYDGVKKFPVIYLLHGARGNETSWIFRGDAVKILDSLYSNSLAVPAIAVFPNMNQYDDDVDAYQSRFKKPFESFFETNGVVETSFYKDVVQTVDSKFKTIADKEHRALVGLSVGAFQAIFISAAEPDAFDYIGLFSPFYKAPVMDSPCMDFYENLLEKQKVQFMNPPQLYSIYIGYWDFFLQHVEYMRRHLDKNGFTYQYHQTDGGHDWPWWQLFFKDFTPRLFRK